MVLKHKNILFIEYNNVYGAPDMSKYLIADIDFLKKQVKTVIEQADADPKEEPQDTDSDEEQRKSAGVNKKDWDKYYKWKGPKNSNSTSSFKAKAYGDLPRSWNDAENKYGKAAMDKAIQGGKGNYWGEIFTNLGRSMFHGGNFIRQAVDNIESEKHKETLSEVKNYFKVFSKVCFEKTDLQTSGDAFINNFIQNAPGSYCINPQLDGKTKMVLNVDGKFQRDRLTQKARFLSDLMKLEPDEAFTDVYFKYYRKWNSLVGKSVVVGHGVSYTKQEWLKGKEICYKIARACQHLDAKALARAKKLNISDPKEKNNFAKSMPMGFDVLLAINPATLFVLSKMGYQELIQAAKTINENKSIKQWMHTVVRESLIQRIKGDSKFSKVWTAFILNSMLDPSGNNSFDDFWINFEKLISGSGGEDKVAEFGMLDLAAEFALFAAEWHLVARTAIGASNRFLTSAAARQGVSLAFGVKGGATGLGAAATAFFVPIAIGLAVAMFIHWDPFGWFSREDDIKKLIQECIAQLQIIAKHAPEKDLYDWPEEEQKQYVRAPESIQAEEVFIEKVKLIRLELFHLLRDSAEKKSSAIGGFIQKVMEKDKINAYKRGLMHKLKLIKQVNIILNKLGNFIDKIDPNDKGLFYGRSKLGIQGEIQGFIRITAGNSAVAGITKLSKQFDVMKKDGSFLKEQAERSAIKTEFKPPKDLPKDGDPDNPEDSTDAETEEDKKERIEKEKREKIDSAAQAEMEKYTLNDQLIGDLARFYGFPLYSWDKFTENPNDHPVEIEDLLESVSARAKAIDRRIISKIKDQFIKNRDLSGSIEQYHANFLNWWERNIEKKQDTGGIDDPEYAKSKSPIRALMSSDGRSPTGFCHSLDLDTMVHIGLVAPINNRSNTVSVNYRKANILGSNSPGTLALLQVSTLPEGWTKAKVTKASRSDKQKIIQSLRAWNSQEYIVSLQSIIKGSKGGAAALMESESSVRGLVTGVNKMRGALQKSQRSGLTAADKVKLIEYRIRQTHARFSSILLTTLKILSSNDAVLTAEVKKFGPQVNNSLGDHRKMQDLLHKKLILWEKYYDLENIINSTENQDETMAFNFDYEKYKNLLNSVPSVSAEGN